MKKLQNGTHESYLKFESKHFTVALRCKTRSLLFFKFHLILNIFISPESYQCI